MHFTEQVPTLIAHFFVVFLIFTMIELVWLNSINETSLMVSYHILDDADEIDFALSILVYNDE
jgi:hypothetical protein